MNASTQALQPIDEMPINELHQHDSNARNGRGRAGGVRTSGHADGWLEWVGGDGEVIGIERLGASAAGAMNFEHYGFTIENVKKRAMQLLEDER